MCLIFEMSGGLNTEGAIIVSFFSILWKVNFYFMFKSCDFADIYIFTQRYKTIYTACVIHLNSSMSGSRYLQSMWPIYSGFASMNSEIFLDICLTEIVEGDSIILAWICGLSKTLLDTLETILWREIFQKFNPWNLSTVV